MSQQPNSSWYSIRKAINTDTKEAEAEVMIYDEIGAYGVTAQGFVNELKAIDTKTINVRLNTPGGEVFDGTAIHNAIKAHPAKVVVHIDGVAASAGSFIAMAGDEIRMAKNAYMMIHNAQGGVMGGASEMRAYADSLEKINGNIAEMYATRAGKDIAHWQGLMDAETWFTAEEAKAAGLVDEVYTAPKKSASVNASFDFKIYNKIPAPVREMWGIQTNNAPETASRDASAPVAPLKEVPAMAETNNAAPAQTPAAPSPSTPQVNPIEREIAQLTNEAATGYIREGHAEGVKEGIALSRERLTMLLAVCPDNEKAAVKAFLADQSPESFKVAFDAAMETLSAKADAKNGELLALQKENARLHKVIGTGGHAGLSMKIATDDNTSVAGLTPKQQAEWEWDNRASVRESTKSKDIYVLAREAELNGQHRSFKRETASVN